MQTVYYAETILPDPTTTTDISVTLSPSNTVWALLASASRLSTVTPLTPIPTAFRAPKISYRAYMYQ